MKIYSLLFILFFTTIACTPPELAPPQAISQNECLETPFGDLADNTSLTAFQNNYVLFGQDCVSETRVCSKGILSGSYSFNQCQVAPASSCLLPGGGTLSNGQSQSFYLANSVPSGQSCLSQTRTCSNGILSGSYTNQSCSVTSAASCDLPGGGTLASGQSRIYYQMSSVSEGQTCASQSRTCNNGSLSGSYSYSSCSVATSISHGNTYTITGSNFGTKADNNTGNYQFSGKKHLLARFTDLDNASTSYPTNNTKSGWQTFLDGIYPILTSIDFNGQAQDSGTQVALTGGPTHSGKWLKRQVTQEIRDRFPSNHRLRNWNLWNTNNYYPKMYVSCYVNLSTIVNPGKYFRFYWTNSNVINNNVWMAKNGGTLTARAESSAGGVPGIYSDEAQYTNNTWVRYEIFADFENDKLSLYSNGVMLKDESRDYNGPISGWLGTGGKLDYFLLSNTIEMDGDNGEFIGHAMPYMDFSFKRIELADSATWNDRTTSVVQIPTKWQDNEIQITINQGTFQNLENKHLFYLDGMTAKYLGPLSDAN